MATTYFPAPDIIAVMVNQRMESHKPLMHHHGVRIGILFAQNDKGPAVKLHGAACNATIRIISHKDRVTKRYDAELVIDERNWDGFSDRQRQALIAHELEHLELVQKIDPDTKVKRVQYDEGGRPKLKLRPGDWDVGDGFASVVAEFGKDAVEYFNIDLAYRTAEYAREMGPPKPEPTLLDGVTVEVRTTGTDGKATSATLTGETFSRVSNRLTQGATNGNEASAGPRSSVDAVADGGEVKHDDDSDDYGFGPSNPRFDERCEGASYDERTNGI